MTNFKRKIAILFGLYIASCITAFVTSFGSMFFCICAAVKAIDKSTATILAISSLIICILFCTTASYLEGYAKKIYKNLKNKKEEYIRN